MMKIWPRTHESASSQFATLSPMFFGDQTRSFRFASGDLTESRISDPGDDVQANEENSGRSPEKGYIRYGRDRLYHPSRGDDFRGPSKPGRCDRAASGKGGLLRTAPGPLAANDRTRQTGYIATSAVPGRSVLAGLLVEEVFRLVFQAFELLAGFLFELAGLVLEVLELRPDLVFDVFDLLAGLVHGPAGFLQLGPGRLHAGFDLLAAASPGGDRQRQAQRNS